MIRDGIVGDAVLIPEYLADRVPVLGRGMGVLEVRIGRCGSPVHEVLGGLEQPSVIAAGADLIARLNDLDDRLSSKRHPLGGRESLFIGQVHSGEIFNQSPTEFTLQGTRRWLPGTDSSFVRKELQDVVDETSNRQVILHERCKSSDRHTQSDRPG